MFGDGAPLGPRRMPAAAQALGDAYAARAFKIDMYYEAQLRLHNNVARATKRAMRRRGRR